MSPAGGRRYFLFAGPRQTDGGLNDLVGVFEDEAAARAAFAATRLRSDQRAEWAELAAIEPEGKVRLLAWFGHERPAPQRARVTVVQAVGPAPRRRTWFPTGRGRLSA